MFSQLSDKLQEIFKDLRGHGVISESNVDAALRQVRMALLEADVDFQVARNFIARVKEKALGESVLRSITPGQQIIKIFHDELTVLLGGDAEPLRLEDETRIFQAKRLCVAAKQHRQFVVKNFYDLLTRRNAAKHTF